MIHDTSIKTGDKLFFQFFDVTAAVQSDSTAFIHFFEFMYQRFLVSPDEITGQVIREYGLYTHQANPWGKPVLVLDGEVLPLDANGVLESYAYDGIINSILASVKSHYLIHAAALSSEGRGVVLAADAGQGKTTLALELAKRQFQFLSDELAAINRRDGDLHAFPRRLRVRPDSLKRVGLSHLAEHSSLVYDKYLLDIDEIHQGGLALKANVNYIILLDHEPGVEESEAITSQAFIVYVERADEKLLAEARRAPGIVQVEAGIDSGYPILRVQAVEKGRAIEALEKICADQKVHILEISKRMLQTPIFHPEARLEPLPRSQAIMGLLRQFQPGHQSALLKEEYGGNSTRLFLELVRLLDGAECYRLQVGPLDETVGLICGMI